MKQHLQKAWLGFAIVIEGFIDALGEHQARRRGRRCDCSLCEDARGLLFQITHCEAVLDGQLLIPAKIRKLRGAGFPSAKGLAEILECYQQRRALANHQGENWPAGLPAIAAAPKLATGPG